MITRGFESLKRRLKRFSAWEWPPTPLILSPHPRLARVLLALGLVSYFILQSRFPLGLRAVSPVLGPADDSYSYILKARQLETCFRQSCKSLEELRQVLEAPADHFAVQYQRDRQFTNVLLVYGPLHSVVMVILKEIGLTWEAAYNSIVVAGYLGLGFATALWLIGMWGPGPAGITLCLLSMTIHAGSGVHYVTPNNLALMIAMALWGVVLSRREWPTVAIAAGAIAMLLIHPLGRIYLGVTILLMALSSPRPVRKAHWAAMVWCGTVLALAFLVPIIVQRPSMAPLPARMTLFALQRNFILSGSTVLEWLRNGGLLALPLIPIGLMSAPPRRRLRILMVGIILFGLLVISLVVFQPFFPGGIFDRVWTPASIFMMSLVGQAIWFWLIAGIAYGRRRLEPAKAGPQSGRSAGQATDRLSQTGLYLGAAGLFLAVFVGWYTVSQLRKTQSQIELWRAIYDVAFDQTQPNFLAAQGNKCGDVLYTGHEASLYFFLTYGGINCGAIFSPTMDTELQANALIENNPDLNYVVATHSYLYAPLDHDGGLLLASNDSLQVNLRPQSSSILSLYLQNEAPAELRLGLEGSEELGLPIEIVIPGFDSTWQTLAVPPQSAAQYTLRSISGGSFVVKGVRLGERNQLHWPWDQAISLEVDQPYRQPIPLLFETTGLAPQLHRRIEVIADGGETILAAVK